MVYDGPNGSSKTACMVFDILPTLEGVKWQCRVKDHAHTLAGVYEGERYVLANIDLYDSVTGQLHPRAVRLVDWQQILNAEHCVILFDEVMGIASARDNAGLPGEVALLLQKLRHFDIILKVTSPRFMATHIDLRGVVKAVTSCRGFFAVRRPGMAWSANRLFNWRTFSTEDLDDQAPSAAARDRTRVRAKIVSWVWAPGSRMFASYDTLGVVSVLARTSASGICSNCGKRRKVEQCTCDHSGRTAMPAVVLVERDGQLVFEQLGVVS